MTMMMKRMVCVFGVGALALGCTDRNTGEATSSSSSSGNTASSLASSGVVGSSSVGSSSVGASSQGGGSSSRASSAGGTSNPGSSNGGGSSAAASSGGSSSGGFACTPKAGTTLGVVTVATGFTEPVALTGPQGDARIFVVEQRGTIKIVKNGAVLPTPFLDLAGAAGPIQCCGEQGLLGLAFHPQFATNGLFYVNFTRKPDGDTQIAEFHADPGSDVAEPTSRRDLLLIDQPYSNHNAGWLEFGIDGLLYIAMGDGGAAGDPGDRAQDDTQMLGKVLRIDVDTRTGTKQYGIPSDNPFASSADGATDPRPEIWQKGLRNPYRFSFDRGTGDIYLGDVGQGAWEEISAGPNVASVNWGWDDREGRHCYEPMSGCLTANRTDPVTEHAAGDGWHSIIGGQVYRGTCFPDLVGQYFYSDYFIQRLWGFRLVNGMAQGDAQLLASNLGSVTHVHSDGLGEMYVLNHSGTLRRIVVP